MEKLNEIYNKLLNRNLNNDEIDVITKKMNANCFDLNQFLKNVLNSNEFILHSLQKIKNTFRKININVEKIDNDIITTYLIQLRNGTPFNTIEKNIISIYKKKVQTKDSKINDKKIKDIFKKILKRLPTNEEYIKYNNYTENALEKSLIHTIEFSNLIDNHLNSLVRSKSINIKKK